MGPHLPPSLGSEGTDPVGFVRVTTILTHRQVPSRQRRSKIRFVEMFFRVIKPLLPLIPIGLFAVGLATIGLGWFRSRGGRPRKEALSSAALDVLLGASILSILILTLPPSIDANRTLDLVPFRQWHGGISVSLMMANIVLFIPLGVLAPTRWRRLDSLARVLLVAALFSLVIEVLQFALNLGRQASITDLILNAMGAGIGYLIVLGARGIAHAAT